MGLIREILRPSASIAKRRQCKDRKGLRFNDSMPGSSPVDILSADALSTSVYHQAKAPGAPCRQHPCQWHYYPRFKSYLIGIPDSLQEGRQPTN